MEPQRQGMKSIDTEKPHVMNCFLPAEWSWNPGIWTGFRDCLIQPARGNQEARAELGGRAPSFWSRPPSCCIGVIRRGGRGGPAFFELSLGAEPRSRVGGMREEGGRAGQAAVPFADNRSLDSQGVCVWWGNQRKITETQRAQCWSCGTNRSAIPHSFGEVRSQGQVLGTLDRWDGVPPNSLLAQLSCLCLGCDIQLDFPCLGTGPWLIVDDIISSLLVTLNPSLEFVSNYRDPPRFGVQFWMFLPITSYAEVLYFLNFIHLPPP